MTEFPDGIADRHVGGQTSRWPYTHWIALLLLGALMALAVSGALGGGRNDVLTAQGSAAAFPHHPLRIAVSSASGSLERNQ